MYRSSFLFGYKYEIIYVSFRLRTAVVKSMIDCAHGPLMSPKISRRKSIKWSFITHQR